MILSFMITSVFATQWLVKSPTAAPQEFVVYAQNSNHEKISTLFLQCDQTSLVHESVKRAQILFLDGDLQHAEAEFTKVTDLKWSCDWSDEERQVIFFSLLRRAQITQNSSERQALLKEAVALDEQLRPDESVFPPPLVHEFRQLHTSFPRVKFTLPELSQRFSTLLRNGRPIALTQLSIEAVAHKARFTFLSDAYLPERFYVTPQDLETIKAEPQALVGGTCHQPQVHESLSLHKNVTIFFALDCLRDLTENRTAGAVEIEKGPTSLTFSPTESPISSPTAEGHWLKRNGWWIGTAIVSTLLVSYHLKNQDKETHVAVPSTTLYQ